jgi:hypothetical protein
VDFVVKDNIIEFYPAFQKPFVMASLAQTAFIGDFSPWL